MNHLLYMQNHYTRIHHLSMYLRAPIDDVEVTDLIILENKPIDRQKEIQTLISIYNHYQIVYNSVRFCSWDTSGIYIIYNRKIQIEIKLRIKYLIVEQLKYMIYEERYIYDQISDCLVDELTENLNIHKQFIQDNIISYIEMCPFDKILDRCIDIFVDHLSYEIRRECSYVYLNKQELRYLRKVGEQVYHYYKHHSSNFSDE